MKKFISLVCDTNFVCSSSRTHSMEIGNLKSNKFTETQYMTNCSYLIISLPLEVLN